MSGVNAPGGYTAETGSMASQAQTINDAAEEAKDAVKDTKPAKVTEAEFGTAHSQYAADFSAAIEALGTGADAMCGSLISLAQGIGSAGEKYAAAESEQSSAANQSGSGL
ncbi:type VII secretion target [Prauserella cavernicola]|uniref:type VII secretion target n=1 Tax=Prauserella cavernicola TaxID=2800127 RepID=UPI0027DE00DA|nr:type VII secretion target [Prauserella cavernicola]